MKYSKDQYQLINGWALSKKAKVKLFNPNNIEELKKFISESPSRSIIARGLGRSYGDAAQLNNSTIIKLDSFNKFEIDFINQTLTVGAGLSFSDILSAKFSFIKKC